MVPTRMGTPLVRLLGAQMPNGAVPVERVLVLPFDVVLEVWMV